MTEYRVDKKEVKVSASLLVIGCLALTGCGGGTDAPETAQLSPDTVAAHADVGSNLLTPQSILPPMNAPSVNLLVPTETAEPVAAVADEEVQLQSDILLAAAPTVTVQPPEAEPTTAWGTYQNLFSVDSPWNSRPIEPVLGNASIPTSTYYPAVSEGAYSTGVFLAGSTDQSVVVKGPVGGKGIWNPDAEQHQQSIEIPRWPASTFPATGSDGHADIVDPVAGVIHSFFKLKRIDGEWRAQQYAWTKLDGRGWGDPVHYFQGARAAGVPTSGGVIRKHEIADGLDYFKHALALSLTYNGLSANPKYVYPATSSDTNAATANSGEIPMGTLLMLPRDFDTSRIVNNDLKKVAETLKRHGAYVVDRNVGTPFAIYVEIGSNYSLYKGGWNNAVASELHRIRAALKPVVSAKGWLNGDGKIVDRVGELNLLSMRGPWITATDQARGDFNTWQQAIVFPDTDKTITQVSYSPNMFSRVAWALPQSGKQYRLTVKASGGARLRLQMTDCNNPNGGVDSGLLENGASVLFTWPSKVCSPKATAISGTNGPSSVAGRLVLQ